MAGSLGTAVDLFEATEEIARADCFVAEPIADRAGQQWFRAHPRSQGGC
jgi:hypothetical protein